MRDGEREGYETLFAGDGVAPDLAEREVVPDASQHETSSTRSDCGSLSQRVLLGIRDGMKGH